TSLLDFFQQLVLEPGFNPGTYGLWAQVLEVSVLSFKYDKVLQEVSTSRFWVKEGYLVVKFDRFEQGFHQRVFFDLFVQGFSVRVLQSSRILSTSLLLGFQVSGLALSCDSRKVITWSTRYIKVVELRWKDQSFRLFLKVYIKKLDGNIIQNHGGSKQVGLKQFGSKQVGFKQLGPGFETGFHGVQDEKRVWFEVELQGAQGNRATEDFRVSNDDAVVAQRQLEDKQLEEKTNTDCLVNKQVHHGTNVGAFIMKIGVPGQEGAEGNAAERYRGDSNMAALGVAGVIKEYAHESLTFRDAVAYEAKQCDNNIYYWKYAPGLVVEAKEVILGMEMFRTQSGNTLRVTRFRFSNGMSIQILLGGHSTLSLEGGLLGNHDEEKKKSGFELRLVAGIATCALTKVVPSPRFQHYWLKLLRIGEG
ncbi:hypothetical protein Tco_0296103, partial [Tanacetum coccineum]